MKRKRSLRQRIMAVFISAVLVAGMTLNAMPITAHAAENVSEYFESNSSAAGAEEAESNASVTTEGENTEAMENVIGNDASEIKSEEVQQQENSMLQNQEMQTDTSGNYQYTVNNDGTVTITGYMGSGGALNIPSAFEEKTVTAIGTDAFKNKNLISVTIPDTVESIGDSAFFDCQALTEITIPSSVTSIGNNAFAGCQALTEITIPSGVTSISDGVFNWCNNLKKVTIPESVTSIGPCAFIHCTSLETIIIPNSVTTIGDSAFWDCQALTEITIPSSVTTIEKNAFLDTPTALKVKYGSCEHDWAKVAINENGNTLNNVTYQPMTHVPAKEATCTKEGNKEYYICSCGDKWFEDEQGNNEITDKDSIVIPMKEHEYGSEWESDERNHWRECVCGAKTDVTIHSYGSEWKADGTNHWHECVCGAKTDVTIHNCVDEWKADGTNHWHECTVCGAKTDEAAHDYGTEWKTDGTKHWRECVCGAKQDEGEHGMTYVAEKAATCTEKGNIAYYICQVCNKWFTDASGNSEITDKDSVVIQKKDHEYDTSEWKTDETNHWHECTCGAKTDEAAHSFGEWNVTTPATETEKGLQERSCTACGYKQTKEIPVKGSETTDTGKIDTDKEQGENAPATDFATPKKDLIEAVLTPEERSLVADGTDIKIVLDIDNIDAYVNQTDKQAVTDKADGYEVGQYLDINLYKLIGTDKTKISQTSGKIRITIAVPDALKNTDGKKARSYAVVRVHDGKAELLTDLDNDEATITIETDLFSTYAIVYKDAVGTSDNNNSGKKDDVPETRDEIPVEIYATLAMIAGFTYLIMLFGGRRKGMTEEKKNELTDSVIAWGKKGGKLRRLIALGIIFIILCYYHSIGKDTELDLQDMMLNS